MERKQQKHLVLDDKQQFEIGAPSSQVLNYFIKNKHTNQERMTRTQDKRGVTTLTLMPHYKINPSIHTFKYIHYTQIQELSLGKIPKRDFNFPTEFLCL